MRLLIFFIDYIDHHFHHDIFLFRTALGNHQCQGYEGVVCYSLSAICGIKDSVLLHEPEKEHGCNTFVAIAEGMVLHYKIKQHGSLFLHRWVEVFASERLINLSYATLEGIIFLIGKPLAATKLLLQGIYGIHCILISGG